MSQTTPPADPLAPCRIEGVPPSAERYDVIVVGAGASGIPAAIAAARQGARVLLLEEDPVAGGAPVDSYVTLLCGGPKVGLFLDLCHRLNAYHDLTGIPQDPFPAMNDQCQEAHWYLPSAFARELGAMIAAEPNITLRCGARVSAVLVGSSGTRSRVLGVAVGPSTQSTRAVFAAPVTIDATGTGAVAALAGCQTAYGRDARSLYGEALAPEQADATVQPCTWMYVSQRIRPDAQLPARDLIPGGFVEPNVGWVKTIDDDLRRRNTGIHLHWGATVTCTDTRDELAIGAAQRQALAILEPVLARFQEGGYAVHLAPRIGVREVRRVLGEYVVNASDLKAGRDFDDAVACNEFMLDVWGANLNEHERRVPRSFIPYRALIPLGTEGLLIAGKAISGSHLAMGAYRVQPVVASIGTAAGLAAAMAAQHQTGVRDIPVNELRSTLRRMGVI